MKNKIQYSLITYLLSLVLILILAGCQSNTTGTDHPGQKGTPVTLTKIEAGPMADYIKLNAVSGFMKKSLIRSNTAAWIKTCYILPGDKALKNQLLFSLVTKEAEALSKVKFQNDSNLNFKGIIEIRAPEPGIISSILHQSGDYVQEGDELAEIADPGSLVFYMQVPFEMEKYIRKDSECKIILPGNRIIEGKIRAQLPVMDIASQTEKIVVKPKLQANIPENLIAEIQILKDRKNNAITLPKEAVLTNETQSDFWVMKLINDSTAVKVPVKKGLESDGKVEIIEPALDSTDRIILTGAYGLEDTSKVKITRR